MKPLRVSRCSSVLGARMGSGGSAFELKPVTDHQTILCSSAALEKTVVAEEANAVHIIAVDCRGSEVRVVDDADFA